MNGDYSNAVAGPSSLLPTHYSSSPSPPPSQSNSQPPQRQHTPPPSLYLLPPAPPPPKQHLASTQDLLARFNLVPAYDRYVRPFVLPGDDPPTGSDPQHPSSVGGTAGGSAVAGNSAAVSGASVDKGKGRDVGTGSGVVGTPAGGPGADGDHGDMGDMDDEDGAAGGKGEKKKKNSYKHLIKGIPGKHSFRKDDSLQQAILLPPKQHIRIRKFDLRTQNEAFTVSLEGLKGWNVNTLILESAQAREDRKKRKELKRLAKLQAQNGGLPVQTPIGTASNSVPSTPLAAAHTPSASTVPPVAVHAPVPTVANGRRLPAAQPGGTKTGGTGTPRPTGAGTPRPVGTPRQGVSTPRPGSTHPITAVSNNSSANVNISNNGTSNSVGSSVGATGGATGGTAPVGGGGIARPTSTVPRPSSTVPRPGSTVPRPGSGKPPTTTQQSQQQRPVANGVPPPPRTATPMDVDRPQQQLQRGIKREREEGPVINGNGVSNNHQGGAVNGHANGNGMANGNGANYQQQQQNLTPNMVMNSKAGSGNVRPRPIKKQKMDAQGGVRDVSAPVQQQPTPQGV